MRKCDDCEFYACNDGEYPEYYCMAGVKDSELNDLGDGCLYDYRVLKRRKKCIDDCISEQHYLPACFDCIHDEVCKIQEKCRPKYNYMYVCDKFKCSKDFVEIKSCVNCGWKWVGRYQKCTTCRRNRELKDRFKRRSEAD
jgi:hypothetical protein